MVLIAQPANAQFPTAGIDPILFVQELLEGFIFDENGKHVPLKTDYPKQINGIPMVAITAKNESQKFISIPAIRRRWTAPFSLEVWAISVNQRYAIKQSLMGRLDSLTSPKSQLAENYVYMWFTTHDIKPDVRTFGQPIYKIGFTITLIYDTLTGNVNSP